jgi:hypothetical protein
MVSTGSLPTELLLLLNPGYKINECDIYYVLSTVMAPYGDQVCKHQTVFHVTSACMAAFRW